MRQHSQLISVMAHNMGLVLGLIFKILDVAGLTSLILRPIKPSSEGLVQSVVNDINILKWTPLIPKDIGLYGFVYR